MAFLNLTIELTHSAATRALVNAGLDHQSQDEVVAMIDRSRIKQRVSQSNVRTWIGEQENAGYRVVDAEIAVSKI